MGNCISKINKDHFFAFEELLKNDILLSGRMMRLALDWGTKRTCMGVYSIKKAILYSETLAPLQTESWWRNIFKRVRCIIKNLRCSMTKGTP